MRTRGKREARRWQLICDLANTSNDAQAVACMDRLLGAFECEMRGDCTLTARGLRSEVRLLLCSVAGVATAGQEKQVRRMLSEPRLLRTTQIELPSELRRHGLKQLSDFRAVPKRDEKNMFWLEPKPESLRVILRERDYQQPLHPIGGFVLDWHDRGRVAKPVRRCALASCGHFFLARGRRKWCSQRCDSKVHQMTRTRMRKYMREYRKRR